MRHRTPGGGGKAGDLIRGGVGYPGAGLGEAVGVDHTDAAAEKPCGGRGQGRRSSGQDPSQRVQVRRVEAGVAGQQGQHRRDRERCGHAMVAHQVDEQVGLEPGCQDDGSVTGPGVLRQAGQDGDVGQRGGDQGDVVRADGQPGQCVGHAPAEVVVGERGRLGASGGARRESDNGEFGACRRIDGLLLPGKVLLCGQRRGGQFVPCDVQDAGAVAVWPLLPGLIADDRARRGLLAGHRELAGGELGVDRDEDRSEPDHREHRRDRLGPGCSRHDDAVASSHAARGQAATRPADPLGQLGVGPRAALVDQGDPGAGLGSGGGEVGPGPGSVGTGPGSGGGHDAAAAARLDRVRAARLVPVRSAGEIRTRWSISRRAARCSAGQFSVSTAIRWPSRNA